MQNWGENWLSYLLLQLRRVRNFVNKRSNIQNLFLLTTWALLEPAQISGSCTLTKLFLSDYNHSSVLRPSLSKTTTDGLKPRSNQKKRHKNWKFSLSQWSSCLILASRVVIWKTTSMTSSLPRSQREVPYSSPSDVWNARMLHVRKDVPPSST